MRPLSSKATNRSQVRIPAPCVNSRIACQLVDSALKSSGNGMYCMSVISFLDFVVEARVISGVAVYAIQVSRRYLPRKSIMAMRCKIHDGTSYRSI